MANVVVDTSGLLAYFDASEPDHPAVDRAISSAAGLLVVSPYVVAELDYLVATRHGTRAELAVLDELSSGAWELPGMDRTELRRAASVVEQYADHDIGVVDASNVVLADRYGTAIVVTLDRRHFETLRTLDGKRFTVKP